METVEFRLPQFSEDSAWLPGWAQHQVEKFDERVSESPGSSMVKSKVSTRFQGNIFTGNDVLLLSKEGRHNSHHLFLSGEDNSASTFAPSSRNVLEFHLHLSSNGFSQFTPSQLRASDASQTFSKPNKVLSMPKFEIPASAKENNLSKMSLNAGDILPQSSSPKQGPHHPASSKNLTRHRGEKLSCMHLKEAEINDAVELSISASEALVIHEMVTSWPDSEAVIAADALEVSLRMKNARLEWLEDAFDFSSKEIDETDSLSDLDDFAMTDAFEDVGLICSSYDQLISDSSICRVKETPACENHYECENQPDMPGQQINFDCTWKRFASVLDSDATLRRELPLESLSSVKQRKLSDDPFFNSSATNVEREIYHSTPRYPFAWDMEQIVGLAIEDLTSSRPQVNENIMGSGSSLNNTRVDTMTHPVLERFKSRWLGGWTAKEEVNALERVKQENPRRILKAFTCETSFLSESADVAPDENSVVQIREFESRGKSQSSAAVEVLLGKASDEILFSQDVVRSSSLSLLDPLCSVVPCSVSIEDVNSAEAQKHNNMETDLETDFRPIAECEMANSHKISSLDAEIQCGDQQVMQIVIKGYEGTVRKHMTSLKTYSTFFPGSIITSDEGILHCNRSFQSQFGWGNIECIGVSDKLSSEHFPLLTSASKCSPGSENEELCETVPSSNPIEQLEKKNASSTDGNYVAIHSPKEGMKPHLLNTTIRRRLQAYKPSIVDSSGGEHPKQSEGTDDVIRLQQSEKPQNIQSIYKNSNLGIIRARKRVHFSEADGQIKPTKNILELNSSDRMCSTMMASKKLKYIHKLSDYRMCGETSLNCCSNVGKGRMLQGMLFLLTGICSRKGEDIKGQIQKHGGVILPDIPSPPNLKGIGFSRSNWYQLPIVLSTRKQQTAKFLYGCAVNTFVLHVDWLTDSIGARSILPPEKYLILPWQVAQGSNIMKQVHDGNANSIFEKVGIMLHGKHRFCTKLEKIVQHGGGQVLKSLQRLVQCLDKEKISVGAIVTENDDMASRHLRQCASEWKIPMMPSRWIIKSLYSGKLLPFTE